MESISETHKKKLNEQNVQVFISTQSFKYFFLITVSTWESLESICIFLSTGKLDHHLPELLWLGLLNKATQEISFIYMYIHEYFFRSLKHILPCILNDCMIFHFVAMTCTYHSIYLVWLLLIQNIRQNMFLAFRFKGDITCFICVCTCMCVCVSLTVVQKKGIHMLLTFSV